MLVNITFIPTLGSLGTKIEYRESTSSTWITPSSPANPTVLSYYPLDLTPNRQYYIRVTTIGTTCGNSATLISVTTPSATNCCPDGYTLSADGTYCYLIESTAATAPTNPENIQYTPFVDYTICGSYIYSPGYSVSGTGTSTKIPVSNTYWVNGAGNCITNQTITDGPLNRTAIWSTNNTGALQTVGFSVCIDVPVTKTYYIGMGVDNYGTIKVDGTTIIAQDEASLNSQYGLVVGAPFKVWHIYPVVLYSGQRVVEIIGTNYGGPAGFGCQIYNNTSTEIAAATSDAQLNIIFDSVNYVGQPLTLGSDGQGYSCPNGYSLNICESPYTCIKVTTAPTYDCTSGTTTSTTTTEAPIACPTITSISGVGGLG